MKAVVQRVSKSSVSVNGNIIGSIKKGLNVLLAVKKGDTKADAEYLAKKIMQLRIFSDSEGKMNLSVQDTGGGVLVISQFTLYGDCKKGNRPSFGESAQPDIALELYNYFLDHLKTRYHNNIQSGEFQADMQVEINNDGPVTLIIESKGKR